MFEVLSSSRKKRPLRSSIVGFQRSVIPRPDSSVPFRCCWSVFSINAAVSRSSKSSSSRRSATLGMIIDSGKIKYIVPAFNPNNDAQEGHCNPETTTSFPPIRADKGLSSLTRPTRINDSLDDCKRTIDSLDPDKIARTAMGFLRTWSQSQTLSVKGEMNSFPDLLGITTRQFRSPLKRNVRASKS
jgi:hypothetical protein